jgi:large subunit ribosomal protein L1
MPKHGKKFQKALEAIDGLKMYDVAEAVELVLKSSYANFDETVDVAVNLGVNPKYSDQMVRGAVSMPHGLGKTVRVVAFCKGENEEKALAPEPSLPAGMNWSRRSRAAGSISTMLLRLLT